MPHVSRTLLPDIDTLRCTGCGRCIAACQVHVLTFETRHWRKTAVVAEPDACTGCAQCEVRCPFGAITVRRRHAAEAISVA